MDVITLNSVFLDRYDNSFMTKVFPSEDLAQLVKDSVEYYERQARRARREANKTREEVRKETINEYEEENRRLKKRLEYAIAFLGSDLELERYKEFVTEHEKCRSSKANSGMIPYVQQYGTGVGVASTVVCQVCGAKLDITDTNYW